MIKLLGILDVAASIILFLLPFKLKIPQSIVLFIAFYLLIKAIAFITNPVSWVDLACSAAIFISYYSVFSVPRTVLVILAFVMLQKGIFSFLASS